MRIAIDLSYLSFPNCGSRDVIRQGQIERRLLAGPASADRASSRSRYNATRASDGPHPGVFRGKSSTSLTFSASLSKVNGFGRK